MITFMEWSYSGVKRFKRIEESRDLPFEEDLEGVGLGGDDNSTLLLFIEEVQVDSFPEEFSKL